MLNFLLSTLVFVFILSGCSSSNSPSAIKKNSYALQRASNASLTTSYKVQTDRSSNLSGTVLLGSGIDAFAAITELFRKAKKTIDVQYYLVRHDLTGHLFYQAIKEAADRGVNVRVLLDDQFLAGRLPSLASLDQHQNIEVRVFHPYSRKVPRLFQYIFRVGSITRRMHNKSIIVDDTITILGGRNIGNKYSEAKSGRVYSDLDVLAVGPIVKDISISFDNYWSFFRAVKISKLAQAVEYNPQFLIKRFNKDPLTSAFIEALKKSPLVKQIKQNSLPFRWAKTSLIVDSPEKIVRPRKKHGDYLNGTELRPYFQKTQDEVLILTSYFIPGKEGLRFFQDLINRKIKVTVMTNSYASTDVKIVNSHYNKYRKDLLKMGVKLYEFKSRNGSINLTKKTPQKVNTTYRSNAKSGLHAKILIFDRKHIYIGAMNLDPRSLYENTEIGVMISSSEITKSITQPFVTNLNDWAYHLKLENDRIVWENLSNPKTVYKSEPDTYLSQRLLMKIMQLIPVESQL